jgi:NADPH2:quinone reductase
VRQAGGRDGRGDNRFGVKGREDEGLGADEVVLRGPDDFRNALLEKTGGRGFDAVLDSASGGLFGTHRSVLRQDRALVTCGAHAMEKVELDVVELFQNGWRIIGFRIAPPDELRAAVDLIRNGIVKILADKTFPMSQAAQALRYLDQQRDVGKVLLVAE